MHHTLKRNICVATTLTILLLNLVLSSEAVRQSESGGPRRTIPRDIRAIRDQIAIARGFGKRAGRLPQFVGADDSTDSMDLLRAPDANTIQAFADNMTDSFPVDWFVEAMQNNPALARTVLRKFVDANGDGRLSADELLRPAVF